LIQIKKERRSEMANPLKIRLGKLIQFIFDILRPNTSNSTDPRVPVILPPASEPVTLSCITVPVSKESPLVWLSATIGSLSVFSLEPSRLVFSIWRGQPDTGELIFSTADNGQGNGTSRTTTFTHVDQPNRRFCRKITYCLTAQAFDNEDNINIIGPVTFTGASIKN